MVNLKNRGYKTVETNTPLSIQLYLICAQQKNQETKEHTPSIRKY